MQRPELPRLLETPGDSWRRSLLETYLTAWSLQFSRICWISVFGPSPDWRRSIPALSVLLGDKGLWSYFSRTDSDGFLMGLRSADIPRHLSYHFCLKIRSTIKLENVQIFTEFLLECWRWLRISCVPLRMWTQMQDPGNQERNTALMLNSFKNTEQQLNRKHSRG